MIQHLTSIIHSEIIGSLWKVVTYLPYERRLRAYWEYFEFRLVWVSDICLLASACAVGFSFGRSSLRKVNLGCRARIHTCGNQLLLNTVFQSYPGQVGSLSMEKIPTWFPAITKHKCVDFSFLSFQPLQPSKNKSNQPSGHRNNTTTNKQLCLDSHKQHFWVNFAPEVWNTLFM